MPLILTLTCFCRICRLSGLGFVLMSRGVQSRVSENSDIRISDIRNFGYRISLSEHISEISDIRNSDIRNFRIPEIGYPKYPNFKRKKRNFGFFQIFSDIFGFSGYFWILFGYFRIFLGFFRIFSDFFRIFSDIFGFFGYFRILKIDFWIFLG